MANLVAADMPILLAPTCRLGKLKEHAIQWGMFAATVILVAGPMAPLVFQALTDKPIYDSGHTLGLVNFYKVFSSELFREAAWNSVVFALLSTLVSQVVGTLQAILVSRANMPGRAAMTPFILLPLFLSPLVVAFGWSILYGRAGYATGIVASFFGPQPWNLESMGGMVLVAGILQAPIAFLYCRGAIALADQSMEDAARSCGASPMTILRRITIPLLLPSIVFSGMINLTHALETLSIPLILGEPADITLLMPLLYKRALGSATPDFGIVAAASIILLAIVVILLFVQSRIIGDIGRYKSVSGKATRKSIFDLGILRIPAAVVMLLYIALLIVGPMLAIFARSFVSVLSPLIPISDVLTLQNFQAIFASPRFRRAVVNSVLLAGGGGMIAVAFAAMVSIVCYRSDFVLRRSMEHVAMIPRAVPGMIAGISFLYAILLVPGIGYFRSTLLIFVIAYSARFLPSALGAIYPTMIQIGPDLDRSARTMGASWWTTCRRILLPLAKPAVLSAYVLIFVQIMREYSMALFLVAPGSEVISIASLQAWQIGDVGMVAAMSTVQTCILGIFVLIANRFIGGRGM